MGSFEFKVSWKRCMLLHQDNQRLWLVAIDGMPHMDMQGKVRGLWGKRIFSAEILLVVLDSKDVGFFEDL